MDIGLIYGSKCVAFSMGTIEIQRLLVGRVVILLLDLMIVFVVGYLIRRSFGFHDVRRI